jgi:tetratricopeptide (TPR) repeat protein
VSYNLGLLLAEMGRLPEAIASLEQATRLDPRFGRAHYNLGLAYREQGRMAPAEAALRRALDIEPASADFLFAMADLLMRQGKTREAREIVKTWRERHPEDPRARQLQAALDRDRPPGSR